MNLLRLGCLYAVVLLSDSAFASQVSVDHVTQVVTNLQRSIQEYQRYGFTVKEGRSHPNGLENAFIQFEAGNEIELMAVVGKPNDKLAENFQRLLHDFGEVGSSVALQSKDLEGVKRSLAVSKIQSQLVKTEFWEYLLFPDHEGLQHIFLINIYQQPSDDLSLYNHHNGAKGIRAVWLDYRHELLTLLTALGAQACRNTDYSLELADVVFVLEENEHRRPQVNGIALDGLGSSTVPALGLLRQEAVTCEL